MPELAFRDLAAIGVERLKGVGDKKLAGLREMGIESVLDLLTLYPRRWVDRSQECRVSDLKPGVESLVLVTVRSVDKRMGRNRRPIVEAVVGDGSGISSSGASSTNSYTPAATGTPPASWASSHSRTSSGSTRQWSWSTISSRTRLAR